MGVPPVVPQAAREQDGVGFDAYELRPSTRELLKHGVRLKLPPQAFRVLQMLVESPGQLISREGFHRALWPADTFVDFDQGLNSAVKKIRDVLNDSAETPRYIETLPRLGYRFVGKVNGRADIPFAQMTSGCMAARTLSMSRLLKRSYTRFKSSTSSDIQFCLSWPNTHFETAT
jgi:DNA-binding winged helix-turn-helix (wHTH) protein